MADKHNPTGIAPQPTTVAKTETDTKPTGSRRSGKPKGRWARSKILGLILELVAIAAGVVAIVFEAKVHHDVNNISKNASTVYLPDWPEHDDDLTSLVSNFESGDELAINSDIGYTHFTQPKQFEKYFKALSDAAHLSSPKRPVKLLVPDYDTNLLALENQFSKDEHDPHKRDFDWLWKNEPDIFKTYCAQYAQYKIGQSLFCRAVSTPEAIPTRENFFDLVMYVEDSLCSELLVTGKVKIRTVHDENLKQRMRYLWIRHRESVTGDQVMKEMIFAYSRFFGPAKGKGYGWRTYDGHLIEVFWREFEDEFEKVGEGTQLNNGDHLYEKAFNKIKQQLKQ